jgi:hypothetical protein
MTNGVQYGVGVDRRLRGVRGLLWSLLGLLAVEFALGMGVNLFLILSLPSGYPGVIGVIASSPLLSAHALLAFLLLILSVILCVRTGSPMPARRRGLSIALAVTLVGTIFAGYSFVESQSNALSYGMALGFIVALLLVVALLHMAYQPGQIRPSPENSVDPDGGN